MKSRHFLPWLSGAIIVALCWPMVLPADEDSRRAREAARRGEVVRLEVLLADAERRHPGQVVEVELEDGEYEIEILLRDGRVVELTYDARTGILLETELDDDDDDDRDDD